MGAYSNPQEIEGQQDLGGYSRALQGMFDKVAAGVENASQGIIRRRLAENEKILQENKQKAAKNEALLKDLDEKEQGMRILLEKGKMVSPKGMNYDCYNTALDKWRELQTKIDKGEGSPSDKRESAQILASVDMFVKGAANTSGIIEKIKVARNNIGDGKIDTKGSDPYMLRAYIALEKREGDKIQPSFGTIKDENGNELIDYSQPGYKIEKWTDDDGTEHPEQFISATRLEESLNGGSDGGIIFQKSFESDNEKVRKAYQADKEGNGIFEYKGEAYTNRVTPSNLSGFARSTQVGTQGTGGVTRQPMRVVDKEKILTAVGTTIDSVSTAAASNPKEAASRYFNYILPAMSEENPNKDQYKNLPEYAKFQPMPDKFSYDSLISLDDKDGLMKTINSNSKAAFVQSLPDSQPFGNPITISDKDYAWEKEANKKMPKNLLDAYNEAKAKGENYVIKSVKLADGKVRNVLIASEKNEKGEDKLFLEIVGYNTNQ
jgi:hypothetical protein